MDDNKEVIALLERCLARAKKGAVDYVGVLLCERPNIIQLETTGASDMEDQLPDVLERFKKSIVPRVANRCALPCRDLTLDASYVCYNIAGMPISYDFVPWLINQEMRRLREKAPAPLKVGLWFGVDGKTGLETEYRSTMYQYVVLPLLDLVGAVDDSKAIYGLCDHEKEFTPFGDLVRAARGGEMPIKLKAREGVRKQVRDWLYWVDNRRPITITLREADHWRHRNSNKLAWITFANDLKKQGHRVIFVRDTARATDPLENQETFPEASVNLEVRTALYEESVANLFVSNGPASLAWFGTRPYVMFCPLDDDGAFSAGTSHWWREHVGMEKGDQWPWANPDQRIVWDLDTYANITQAWKELNNAVSIAA